MKYSDKLKRVGNDLLTNAFQVGNLAEDYSPFRAILVDFSNDILKNGTDLISLGYKIEDTEYDWDLTEE